MEAFEIYEASGSWKNCDDDRPYVLVRLSSEGRWDCFPVSGACYSGNCFEIPSDDPDFAATGLKKTSHVHDERYYQPVPKRRIGRVEGALLDRFRKYAGV